MLPRPAWLAIGIAAAAAAGTAAGSLSAALLPRAGVAGAAGPTVAAAGVAAAVIAAACACDVVRRPAWAACLGIAALGAAIVAARLAGGAVLGGSSPGVAPLPTGTGPWQATVESARQSKGQQIATLVVSMPSAGTDANAAAGDSSPGAVAAADPAAGPAASAAADPASAAAGSAAGSSVTCSALAPSFPRLVAGDLVTWSGRIRALGDSDYEVWLAAQGIAATCEPTELAVVGHDDSPAGRLEGLRQASGDWLQRVLPEPEGGLAAAILIGLRDRVDRSVAADFTTAGVSHIVAISGWNIAIVAATVAALLGGLVGRRRRAVITLAAIVAYTLFAGASPSVVRAAVMAAVALLAVESGRGSRAMVGLAWAVGAMLVVEPGAVGDAGFELSAAATAGLLAWATPLTRRLEAAAPWLPGSIRESLAISLAAQASTLPIALAIFGRLAVVAPAANLVAVPLVPPAMAAGAVAFISGGFCTLGAPSWLCGLLALPAWALLAALIWVVHLAATIPGANETLAFPANAAAAAAAGLALCLLHRQLRTTSSPKRNPPTGRPVASSTPGARDPKHRPRHRRALVAAAFVVALAGCVVSSRPDGSVHVIVLDVGQGDAILLEGDRGGRILIDGGPDGSVLLNVLDRYVPAWDRRLDAIVLTHPHDDHVGGLVTVVDKYRVGRAFESGWAVATPDYRAWLDALAAHGLRPERLRTGDTLRLDDATLHVLWPDDGTVRPSYLDSTATDNRKTNDASIVMLGEYENRHFLLTGDAEDDVDPVLLARGLPTVDMLKVAHHGSATASSDDILAALRPSVAVVSVGAGNTYGHPAPATIARLRAHAGTVLRTDQVGTVETTLNASAVTVSSARVGFEHGSGDGRLALAGAPASGCPGLLYDSFYVSPEPSGKRGPAALARAAGLASTSLSGRGGDGWLAGVASGVGRPIARPPPRRGRGAPPRRRQAAGRAAVGCGAGPRRRFGRMACPARSPGAGRTDRRPSGDTSCRRPLVRPLVRGRIE
jgi:competence protein ComEC